MKKILIFGTLLGLLTGVGFAQRGRPVGTTSPVARPDMTAAPARTMPNANISGQRTQRTAGATATASPNSSLGTSNASPTAAPIRDPQIRSTTVAPNGTVGTRNVSPTAAPIRDPQVGFATVVPNGTEGSRNVDPTAAPIKDPEPAASKTPASDAVPRQQ